LKTIPARGDKRTAYEAAVKAAMNEPKDGATTMKKRAAEKLAAKATPTESAEAPVQESTPEAKAEVAAEVEAPIEQPATEQATGEPTTTEAAAE
jgi:small subunit ribosomal protein S16